MDGPNGAGKEQSGKGVIPDATCREINRIRIEDPGPSNKICGPSADYTFDGSVDRNTGQGGKDTVDGKNNQS